MRISRYIVYFIVATIPILFGAVQPWVWSIYTVCIFTAFFILLLQDQDRRIWIHSKIIFIFLGSFFVVTLSQFLPIPFSVLSFLSPIRYDLLARSSAIVNSNIIWHTLSYSPLNSLAWWLFLLSLLLFFFVFRNSFKSSKHLRFLVWILFGVASFEALYGLVQALVPTIGVLWVDYVGAYLGDARGTYINRNHFAGFIEMMLPLLLGYVLSLGNWQVKLSLKALMSTDRLNFQFFLTIGLTVMALALLFSKSRAGITSGVLGFLTFVVLLHFGSKGIPRSFWVVTGIIVGIIAFYSFKIGVDPVLERFLRVSKSTSRMDFWSDSLMIIKDHPFGTGLATFKQVFPVYNVSTVAETTPHYAHNDYLQLLVETGWIGFLALVTAFFLFLMRSFQKVKQMRLRANPFRFFMAIGALSGLVSIAFHSFFDFNLQIPANCVYFVMLLGIVDITLWQDKALIDRKQN